MVTVTTYGPDCQPWYHVPPVITRDGLVPRPARLMHGDDRRARQHAALFVGDRAREHAGRLCERRVRDGGEQEQDENTEGCHQGVIPRVKLSVSRNGGIATERRRGNDEEVTPDAMSNRRSRRLQH